MRGHINPIQQVRSHWRPAAHGNAGDDSTASAEKEALVAVPSTPPRNAASQTTTTPQPNSSRATRVWDVKMPPVKKHMVHGMLMPTVGGAIGSRLLQKARRISVEIHVEEADFLEGVSDSPTRGANHQVMQGLLRGDSHGFLADNEQLHEGEKVLVRLLKPADKHDEHHDDSSEEGDHSISTLGFLGADEKPDPRMWTQRHIYDLDHVEILKTKGAHTEVKFGHGSDTQVRLVNFCSEKEAASFSQVLSNLRRLQSRRTEKRVQDFRIHSPEVSIGSPERGLGIGLLVEIVSGIDLPVADIKSTDPYVIVRLGSQEVHRTKPIDKTVNPIWTIDNGSLFLLSVTPEAFFGSSSGLTFILKDYDSMSSNETLGKVVVSQEELLKGEGERKEYKLAESFCKDKMRPGKLVLRFRKATEEDVVFMERLASAKRSNIMGVYGDETFVQPRVTGTGFLKREARKVGGATQMRVKPTPDPERPTLTKWMTSKEIDKESEKPSRIWIEAGSGEIGRLFVEVICCDGLPNMDTRTLGQGKTDAFACLIYEDCIVNTEVINDTLSPRWMPWTQRAFIFHMMHPSSQLMVGVFDFDSEHAGQAHDSIGRATIDITNFRADTEYTLYYDLYTSALVAKRKSKGQIKLRLRMEIPDKRKAILAGVVPPPQIYLNVASLRDFKVANFACEGKYNIHRFDMDLLTGYVDELQQYECLISVVRDAALTVFFWRGHFPVQLRIPQCPSLPRGDDRKLWDRYTKAVTIRLPLHSMTAFVGGIFLAENYNLLPSFMLFALAWFLLATSDHLSHHPSPWENHHKTFVELFSAMVFPRPAVETIQPHQNEEAVKKFLAEKEEAEAKRKEEAEKKASEGPPEDFKGELEALNDGEEVKMTQTRHGFHVSVNPLKPILFSLQQNLELACVSVRVARSLVTWEESVYAFWIVLASLAGGLVLLFVPWDFLFHWVFRICVWVFLGPWMKLVDIFVMKKVRSGEEEQKEAEARVRAKYDQLLATALHRQTRKEELTKLKQMKRYMFGKFLTSLPRFKQARHIDIPLPSSHASPFVADTNDSYEIACRKYGQHLTGDMIPTREIEKSTESSPLNETRVQLYGSSGSF